MNLPQRRQIGGALVFTLVFMILLLVFMTAGMRLITRQFHATVDQEQEERAFEVADAGAHHAFWLIAEGNIDPNFLVEFPPGNISVSDPATGNAVGFYDLSFAVQGPIGSRRITATAVGRAVGLPRPQTIVLLIQEYDAGGGVFGYYIRSWNHLS